MQTLAMVLWTATILLEVKGQEDELWDPWADNCESMVPCNLTEPQTDPMPYIVTLNRPYINSDQAVYVYIRTLPPLSFQGFMIQARDDKTDQAVGEFDTDNRKISVINCFGRPDMLTSGVQFIMEASFPAEQQNPGNWCLRPPMMREQQVARVPLLDLTSHEQRSYVSRDETRGGSQSRVELTRTCTGRRRRRSLAEQ
ncbi:hypothetical protein J6590_087977 [Homalodisca vitripennis]|nr:hypothetical protein J6590_087977 [Homalodisca vitripennis]